MPSSATSWPATYPAAARAVVAVSTLAAAALVAPAAAQQPVAAAEPHVAVPAFTAFARPEPDRMRRNDDGSVPRAHGELRWYVDVAAAGELRVALERAADAPATQLVWSLQPRIDAARATGGSPPPRANAADGKNHDGNRDANQFPAATTTTTTTTTTTVAAAAGQTDVPLGAATLAPGPHCLSLRTADGSPLAGLSRLHLRGPAAAGLHTNVAERRNAASIHLGYVVPKDLRDDVAWFVVDVTPRTEPLWSYYMAAGWHRGYFGMQVNSPSERRVIFSVWDSGDEAIDRSKVAASNRVTLVAKGDGVHAGDFGNEGTGGHSHWKHGWRLGETFRFLLHARVDGTATVYTGWFWLAEAKAWRLIASFRAPKDGRLPHGLYSFSENFHGANGDLRREAEFGNVFVRAANGPWTALADARFTHDPTGDAVRRDRWGLARGDRFVLGHGDFLPPPQGAVTRAGGALRVDASTWSPPDVATLPTPPAGDAATTHRDKRQP